MLVCVDQCWAIAGGEDGVAGGSGGGERAPRRLLRDVAGVVLAVPHGDVRGAGARRLVLPDVLRVQVRGTEQRRRPEQEDPRGRRREEFSLPQDHPLRDRRGS